MNGLGNALRPPLLVRHRPEVQRGLMPLWRLPRPLGLLERPMGGRPPHVNDELTGVPPTAILGA